MFNNFASYHKTLLQELLGRLTTIIAIDMLDLKIYQPLRVVCTLRRSTLIPDQRVLDQANY